MRYLALAFMISLYFLVPDKQQAMADCQKERTKETCAFYLMP